MSHQVTEKDLVDRIEAMEKRLDEMIFRINRNLDEARGTLLRAEGSLLSKGPKYMWVGDRHSTTNPKRLIQRW